MKPKNISNKIEKRKNKLYSIQVTEYEDKENHIDSVNTLEQHITMDYVNKQLNDEIPEEIKHYDNSLVAKEEIIKKMEEEALELFESEEFKELKENWESKYRVLVGGLKKYEQYQKELDMVKRIKHEKEQLLKAREHLEECRALLLDMKDT